MHSPRAHIKYNLDKSHSLVEIIWHPFQPKWKIWKSSLLMMNGLAKLYSLQHPWFEMKICSYFRSQDHFDESYLDCTEVTSILQGAADYEAYCNQSLQSSLQTSFHHNGIYFTVFKWAQNAKLLIAKTQIIQFAKIWTVMGSARFNADRAFTGKKITAIIVVW